MNDGTFDSTPATVSITVVAVNDPPVIAFTSGDTTADEGQTKTYTFSITDPDSTTFTYDVGYPKCGTGGTLVGTPSIGSSSGSFQCSFPDGPATPSCCREGSDASDPSNEATRNVTVNNVAPSVVVTGPSPVDEAQTLRNYVFDTSDPGVPDTFTHGPASCGASGVLVGPVVFNAATGDGNFDCRFADDNPTGTASDTSTVSITVSDDDTGSGSGSKDVTVNNVAPSVVVTGPSPVDEAQTLRNYVFDTSDPGVPDTFTHGPASCGASGVLVGPVVFNAATGDGNFDCRFADDNPTGTASDTSTVSITVSDDDTGSGSGSKDVTVNNVAPSVVVTGPSPVDEAQTLRNYVFDTSDPGVPDTFTHGPASCGASGVLVGPVVFNAATGDGNFDCRFADDNPTGTASDTSTVSITVSDDDTGSGSGSKDVTVNNVAPSVVVTGPSPVDEAQTLRNYVFDTSDPGVPDTFTHGPASCGASGVLVGPVVFNAATGDGNFDCRFADDNPTGTASDTSTVSITVSDDDTGSGSGSKDVTVNNVAPSVVVTGPSPVDEAQTLRNYVFDTSDPGVPDTFTHGPASCGASGVLVGPVVFNAATGDGNFDCRFADDNPTGTASDTSTVSITVSDDDTGSGSGSKDVTVNNVAPSVVVTGPSPVDEAQTLRNYVFDTSDPGVPDTFTHGPASCGASGVLVGPVVFNAATGDGNFDCRFADDNPTGTASDTSTVSITVSDDDTGSGSGSKDVTVNNVAPSVVVTGPSPVDEAQTLRNYVFDTSDPGVPDTFTHGPASCGASGVLVGPVVFNAATGDGNFDCRFADDNPTGTASDTSTVSITVSDDDTGSGSGSKDVTVNNVAPSVVVTGPSPVDEAQTLRNYVFDTSDPGVPDTFTHGPASCGASGVLVGPVVFNAATGDGNFDCRFADDNPTGTASDTSTVSITVSDDDTGSGSGSKDVTVNNVAPSVVVTGPSPVDEAQTLRNYVFDTSDPGVPDTFTHGPASCGASGVLVGPVVFNAATGDGNFDCRFADDNPTGTASDTSTVSITVSDDDTGSGSGSKDVTVNNVAPSVVVTGPSPVDEAQTLRNYVFDTSDPGVPDTFTHGPASCGASGVLVGPVVFNAATGDGNFDCRFADDNPTGTASDTSTVSITVSDDDTGSGSGSKDVTVNNVAPSVVVTGPSPVDEAQTLRNYVFDTSDPGVPDTFTHGPASCGASGVLVGPVVFNAATGDGNFDCRFADDNPTGTASDTSTVSITVSDDDTGSGSGSKDVTVNNVAPSVVVTGPSPVDEAQTLRNYVFDTSDPGVPDTFTHGPASCGASGVLVGPVVFNAATGDGNFDCRFADDNPTGTASDTSTVSITVSDDDTGSGSGSKDVTVNNVAPTVTLGGPNSANEGETKNYSFTTSDPGMDTFVLGPISCGASGSSPSSVVFNSATGAGSFSCTFTDDNPTGTPSDTSVVSVAVSDDDGGSDSATLNGTVNNVAPVITGMTGPIAPISLGGSATVTTSFTDVGGLDTHTCTYSWDDGTPNTTVTAPGTGSGSCSASHVYASSGVYTVGVTVKDDDTGSATSKYEFVVVFDPSGGFVTGGGWINSPAGAYRPDPTLTGKANFGFVSKYKKGASVPEGQTEFQFHAGNLNFHSEVYQWLVVAGNKAQYKGTGTINGSGSYGFLLTAYDGSPDRFRIKITGSGGTVYDNKFGSSDDMDAADPQAISGGSIVVHKG